MGAYEVKDLFSLDKSIAGEYLAKFNMPWDALGGIAEFITQIGKSLPKDIFSEIQPGVWAAKSADIAPNATLIGPAIIDEDAEIRHCAFLRGACIIGKGAVVGNSCEIKNSILFDDVQVPHFNYVGDSILGHKAHLGAGAVTSNVKSDKSNVVVKADGEKHQTGRKKLGAMLGDDVEIGCNSVLCPGCHIGKNSSVYPLSCVRGTVPPNCIFKAQGNIVEKI